MNEKSVLEIVETARGTGKIRRGINEVTKSLERGESKAVIVAEDINPPEVVAHIPLLCDEKKVPFLKVPNKLDLGRAAGIDVGTSAISIVEAGEGKKLLADVLSGK
jgi:large subunit ribosomal protein L7Ae